MTPADDSFLQRYGTEFLQGLIRGDGFVRYFGHHAGSDRAVGFRVDENASAGVAVLSVGVDSNRAQQLDGDDTDAVHLQCLCGLPGQSTDVSSIFKRGDEGRDSVAGVLEQVAAIALKRALIHPDKSGFEALYDSCGSFRRSDEITAADVEFAAECQCDREWRVSFGKVAIPADDACDFRGSS